jgi:hypothetical protein
MPQTRLLLAFLVLLAVPALLAPVLQACQIAFRLDGVQEGKLVESQIAVIESFLEHRIPLTLGVDASLLERGDEPMQRFLQSISTNPFIEIACHARHDSFAAKGYEKQASVVSRCKSKLESYFVGSRPVVSFLTPFNSFDKGTLRALAETGFDRISAHRTQCPPDPPSGARQRPTWAATSFTGGEVGFGDGCPAMYTMGEIRAQVDQCGFSVVTLTPQEFYSEKTTSRLNVTMLMELESLLSQAPNIGCELHLLRDLDRSPPLASEWGKPVRQNELQNFLAQYVAPLALVGGLVWFYWREWNLELGSVVLDVPVIKGHKKKH